MIDCITGVLSHAAVLSLAAVILDPHGSEPDVAWSLQGTMATIMALVPAVSNHTAVSDAHTCSYMPAAVKVLEGQLTFWG